MGLTPIYKKFRYKVEFDPIIHEHVMRVDSIHKDSIESILVEEAWRVYDRRNHKIKILSEEIVDKGDEDNE